MTAMSSASEVGSLLQTLQTFNNCADFKALIDAARSQAWQATAWRVQSRSGRQTAR